MTALSHESELLEVGKEERKDEEKAWIKGIGYIPPSLRTRYLSRTL